ncbi:MAG: NAD-dependent epimerase/dehydratase family protein [Acidobacteria bacterium]|nr:NAD-dependent epimerase/dehydratase family protein [Acidobacteriota bacterium]
MFRRALVTGGAGFIGSHLARALLGAGLEVVVLDNLSMGKVENVPRGAHLRIGDVRSEADVRAALDGVDVVFHEAARVSIRASIKEFFADADTNFMGTLNVLRSAAGSGVRRLMFASSMAVYADSPTPDPIDENHACEPISPYGVAKLAAEKYCLQLAREMGIDCHVLRYFNTYGPGQTFTPYVGVITIFIRRLLAGEAPTIYGDGEQRRDFVHVSDVVAANLLAMNSSLGSGVFNVGTGRATSVNDIAALLCARLAPDIRPIHLPPHAGELRYSIADISRLRDTLGYRPRAVLADELDAIIAHHRDDQSSA